MRPTFSRLALGCFLIAAAVLTRCFATAHGGVVMTLGDRLPALTKIDFLTAPVAFAGIAVLGGVRGLGHLRRIGGLTALVTAIAWPAIKFGDISPVILSLSARHGVHTHDLAAFPVLAAALTLLVPWRGTVRLRPSTVPAVAVLRPALRG